jgi:hypothetical protein
VFALSFSDLSTWTKVQTSGAPPTAPRAAFEDPAVGCMVVVEEGGTIRELSLGEAPTWSLLPTPALVASAPPTYAFDASRSRLMAATGPMSADGAPMTTISTLELENCR